MKHPWNTLEKHMGGGTAQKKLILGGGTLHIVCLLSEHSLDSESKFEPSVAICLVGKCQKGKCSETISKPKTFNHFQNVFPPALQWVFLNSQGSSLICHTCLLFYWLLVLQTLTLLFYSLSWKLYFYTFLLVARLSYFDVKTNYFQYRREFDAFKD